MNAQATRRGVPAAVFWGGLGVVAWAALTAVVGGGSAHADDRSDPSLLAGVGSVVSETVDTVGQTVTAVTTPVVTEVVKPVVTEVVQPIVAPVVAPVQQAAPDVVQTVTDTVAAAPVVGPATAPIVSTVTDTAEAVVTPVTDLLTESPVSQIVTPIRDAVGLVPLVGGLLEDLGVTPLIDQVVDVVDETTAVIGDIVDETVPPILGTVGGTPLITAPGVDGSLLVAGTPTSQASAASADARAGLASAPGLSAGSGAAMTVSEPLTAAPVPTVRDTAPATPSAPWAPATSSSATSGGASALSHARLSGVDLPELRAWELSSGASDDVLPASTVADTDVSPD